MSDTNEYSTKLTKCQAPLNAQSCIIVQEMAKILNGVDGIPDYKPCRNFNCKHNIFNYAVRAPELYAPEKFKRFKHIQTKMATEILNCGRLISNPWTLKEVGDAYGKSDEGIRKMEIKLFKKLAQNSQAQFLAEEYLED